MTKPKRYKRYSGEFKREAMLRASEDHAVQKNFPAGRNAPQFRWSRVSAFSDALSNQLVIPRREEGESCPHQKYKGEAEAQEILEAIMTGPHDEQVGLISNWRGKGVVLPH
jgi:hypothetical protein